MFKCEECGDTFTRRDSLIRHQKSHQGKNELCDYCGHLFSRFEYLKKHVEREHGTTVEKPQKLEMEKIQPTTSGSAKKTLYCVLCKIDVLVKDYVAHLKSNRHKKHSFVNFNDDVQIIRNAFKFRIATFKICNKDENELSPSVFLESIRDIITKLLREQLIQHRNVKFNIELFGLYMLPSDESESIKSFNTKNVIAVESSDIDELMDSLFRTVTVKTEEFQERDSGWALKRILHLEINVNKYDPLKVNSGSSYIELPNCIKNKKACINVVNHDNYCFAYAVIAGLYPVAEDRNCTRISSYPPLSVLNLKGLKFPLKTTDIVKFERLNPEVSVNVFGLEKARKRLDDFYNIVGPLYYTKCKKSRHVNLLYFQNKKCVGHYCYIKSLSRLVGSQLRKDQHKKYICDGCLIYFSSEQKLDFHIRDGCNKVSTILPPIGSVLKFENHQHKLKVPFTIYADFESILIPIETCEPDPAESFMNLTHRHEPSSFCYFISCSYDDNLSTLRMYRGPDCAKTFVENLIEDAKRIGKILKTIIPMNPLTDAQQKYHDASAICHICCGNLNLADKVRDHDHLTGLYRGPAHSECNLNYKVPQFIPIFLHNGQNYDNHLFIKELCEFPGSVEVLSQNKESYISITKYIRIPSENLENNFFNRFIKLRFLDSFRFMSSSLDNLIKTLEPNDFEIVRRYFPDDVGFNLIKRKGVYPYEYTNSWEKFEENALPSQADFYSSLRNESISDEDYRHAQTVWNHFEIESLGDYSDLYLKTDVLLLAQVFEKFRNVCLSTYDLDPCQYYTSPGLAWSSMLKYTKIELQLMSDINMINFIKKSVRGGISIAPHRYAKANNKYMSNFNPSLESKYLIYLDANNLYGWAMSQYLPFGNFRWLENDEINSLNIVNHSDMSDVGYILEVDLEYPTELHDIHNDFPFCPENIIPPNGKDSKLIPNLFNKKNYVLHYRNLKQCLKHGLILQKIHRVLSFTQKPWLKDYIDLNTRMRQAGKSDFESDFFKLMNNSVFGKTMENVDNRVDIRLAKHWHANGNSNNAGKLISFPNFHSCAIFDENLVAVQLNRLKVVYDKPTYIGSVVLDVSKCLMYSFHYDYMVPKYGSNVNVLYSDTDSLLYQVKTLDFYADIRSEVADRFDTSNYEVDNIYKLPVVNKKVLGLMKDENAGRIFQEYAGLRSKLYATDVEDTITKKAKGVKDVAMKQIGFHNYLTLVNSTNKVKYQQMTVLKSIKHVIFTQNINKIALSGNDDKRYLRAGRTDTYAWGHYKIKDDDNVDNDIDAIE